jgi:hypothetical protein
MCSRSMQDGSNSSAACTQSESAHRGRGNCSFQRSTIKSLKPKMASSIQLPKVCELFEWELFNSQCPIISTCPNPRRVAPNLLLCGMYIFWRFEDKSSLRFVHVGFLDAVSRMFVRESRTKETTNPNPQDCADDSLARKYWSSRLRKRVSGARTEDSSDVANFVAARPWDRSQTLGWTVCFLRPSEASCG